MTARAARRRHSASSAPRLLTLGALVVLAVLAPGLLEQAAAAVGELLGLLALGLAELLHQTVVQPLLDGLAKSLQSAAPPAAGS